MGKKQTRWGWWAGLMALSLVSGALWAERSDVPGAYARGPAGNTLTDKEWKALDGGKILVHLAELAGTPVKRATAVALVDAAPAAVFSVLTDYDELSSFMPYCEKTEREKHEGDQSWVRFRLDFPWPIGDRHYTLRLTDRQETAAGTAVWTSRWQYVPGSGNINDTYGAWEVLAYGKDRSFLRYTVFTDPGGKLPNWARNLATEVAVPKVIKNLRKRVLKKAQAAKTPSGNR